MDELKKHEPPISAGQLLREILSLLQDYFEGTIYFRNQSIVYRLPNGQTFVIKAKAAN